MKTLRCRRNPVRLLSRKAIVAFGLVLSGLVGASPAQVQTATCPAPGFGPVALAPPVLLTSLKTVANPVLPNGPNGAPRADLADYIANVPAAIQLGKALFWDMQVGSDYRTACATCHFAAGADARTRNQLNPGANAGWDGAGPNHTLAPGDFPFTLLPSHDTDNIAGSQGVRKSSFQGFSRSGAELTASVSDPVFNLSGKNVRQVTGMQTPATINAVFNHRNFWNGRAQPEFNGANPWGGRDTAARVWVLDYRGNPVAVSILIKNASLAAQAVGPPLSPVEMSASGRTFPDLGKKMLALKPLGLQKVDPTDSVLGGVADAAAGLTVSYKTLIQQAFQPKWWNSNKNVSVNGKTYTMMQANFSLYWGLAIMMYEATLVSDDTPMDRYLAAVGATRPGPGDPSASLLQPVADRLQSDLPGLTVDQILNGLALFELPVAPPPSFPVPSGAGAGCAGCHVSAELTSASARNLIGPGLEVGDIAFKSAGFDLRMERMFMKFPPVPTGTDAITFDPSTYTVTVTDILVNGSSTPVSPPQTVPVATYDAGWYNVGVRPTADDPGLGGTDPFGGGLSWTRLYQALSDPSFIKVPGNGLGCATAGNATFPGELLNASGYPLLSGPLHKDEATDVPGSFKVPALRNLELTAPYFHNGGKASLAQVLNFYNGGGDFDNPTKAPLIVPLQLTDDQKNSLIAFLLSLTDERVRWQQAPFDHPQLFIPDGANSDASDNTVEIPAVGAFGATVPLPRFLYLNPFLPN